MQQKKVRYLTGLLLNKGDSYLGQYKASGKKDLLGKAIQLYKVSDKFLDRVRLEQVDPGSKLFWRKDSRRLYEQSVEACYLQGNIEGAFYFFEKSRAVLLNDQLNEQKWMGENDIQQQTQLKKRIVWLERELSKAGLPADRYVTIKSDIFKTNQELDRLENRIKSTNPLYFQSFLDTGFITISVVQQKLLKDHHALLEIFSGDSAVYVLLITEGTKHLSRIDKQDYDISTGQYISYLSNPELMNRDFSGFTRVSNHLYKLIFQQSTLSGKRIIISPDGQNFPFEALVTSKPDLPIEWFLNDHAVSYTYSARFLMNKFLPTSAGAGKNFMGVAPVNYPAGFSLSALTGSDQSLYKIADYFDGAVSQVAAHASRNNFLQQFSQYRIIQLYTHAADSSGNNEPVIYFADSALYLSDLITGTQPVTQLIVLSACETGKGKIYQGEGVFSFNRGFAALGIPSAITNLWSVDNGSTYLLTELFYKWLSRGFPADLALQKAKLEFLRNASKEKAMPCFWAGPVLVGKTDEIDLNKPFPGNWVVLLIGVGLAIFLAVRRWSAFKKARMSKFLSQN